MPLQEVKEVPHKVAEPAAPHQRQEPRDGEATELKAGGKQTQQGQLCRVDSGALEAGGAAGYGSRPGTLPSGGPEAPAGPDGDQSDAAAAAMLARQMANAQPLTERGDTAAMVRDQTLAPVSARQAV